MAHIEFDPNAGPVTLDDMKARYGTPPDDLTVDIRGGYLTLMSGGQAVRLEIGGRYGVFRNGAVRWETLLMMRILPALAQFQRGKG